jgi:hypothetical protein
MTADEIFGDQYLAMGSLVADLIVTAVELIWWVFWDVLPALCYFTAFALVFAATLGRVSVERPENFAKLHWTGLNWVKHSPQGRTILSPALGVIIGFIIWAIIVGASIIYWYG